MDPLAMGMSWKDTQKDVWRKIEIWKRSWRSKMNDEKRKTHEESNEDINEMKKATKKATKKVTKKATKIKATYIVMMATPSRREKSNHEHASCMTKAIINAPQTTNNQTPGKHHSKTTDIR
jgi:hypothetical protein